MRYAITRTDGGVSLMQLVSGTAQEAIAKWSPKNQASVVSVVEIDESSIPQDRTYRNAWKLDGAEVTHDMEKARNIHREHIRLARAPLLDALDAEFQRAYKDPIKQDEIEAKKQVLRDVTADPAIDAAASVTELKAAWPTVLNSAKVRS